MHLENRAVFLDRDGVLIRDVHYLSDLKQVSVYQDVPEGLQTLRAHGYKLILVTNQSGIARGYFDEAFVQTTHRHLNRILQQKGVDLDDVYYCPHHPDGHPPYNIRCDCRKPSPGMILKAIEEHGIDCSSSFVIGDKLSDMELALNVKARGLLLTTGHGEKHAPKVRSRYPSIPIFQSFSAAVSHISERC